VNDPELELQAIDKVVDRLAARFPAVTRDQVTTVVAECLEQLAGSSIRDYVPVLVERSARGRLRDLATANRLDSTTSSLSA